jgi:small-conductance mechanosensitive channel
MNAFLSKLSNEAFLKEFLFSLAIFLAVTIALLVVRKVSLRYLRGLLKKTGPAADVVIESIKWPSIFWIVAIGLYVALDTSDLPERYIRDMQKALYAIIFLSITLTIANFTSRLVQNAIEKSTIHMRATGLSRLVIKGFILIIGGLIILNGLGISITPMLTALGVGGLAVALALQDTLSNLIAGVHVVLENSIKVGDYIKLNTGEEGTVIDIGWRTARIKDPFSNTIIIPNSKLAQSNVTNYLIPENSFPLSMRVRAGYEADPERVEMILVDEARKAAGEVKGLLADPPPVALFVPGFGESSLDFTLICQVSDFTEQGAIQHELRKRIYKRFKQEGISMPYTVRTVNVG